jgi:hypothetical protein
MKYKLNLVTYLWRYPMPLPERYGNRKVPKMMAEVNNLRNLINSEGSEDIQEAWMRVEEFLDFLYQEVGQEDNAAK